MLRSNAAAGPAPDRGAGRLETTRAGRRPAWTDEGGPRTRERLAADRERSLVRGPLHPSYGWLRQPRVAHGRSAPAQGVAVGRGSAVQRFLRALRSRIRRCCSPCSFRVFVELRGFRAPVTAIVFRVSARLPGDCERPVPWRYSRLIRCHSASSASRPGGLHRLATLSEPALELGEAGGELVVRAPQRRLWLDPQLA